MFSFGEYGLVNTMKCKNCIAYPLVEKLPDDAYGVVCGGCSSFYWVIPSENNRPVILESKQ